MSELLEAQGQEHNEAVPDSFVLHNKKVDNVRKASWAYVKDYTRKHTEAHGDIAPYLVKYLSDPPKKRRKRKGVERSPEVEPEVERPSAAPGSSSSGTLATVGAHGMRTFEEPNEDEEPTRQGQEIAARAGGMTGALQNLLTQMFDEKFEKQFKKRFDEQSKRFLEDALKQASLVATQPWQVWPGRNESAQRQLVVAAQILAVTEYIKQNEGSVRAAAIREYSKANQHDQAFVAAAATEYMEAHKDDEYFFGKAVDAYITANKDTEELRDAAAEKYKGDTREKMRERWQAMKAHHEGATRYR